MTFTPCLLSAAGVAVEPPASVLLEELLALLPEQAAIARLKLMPTKKSDRKLFIERNLNWFTIFKKFCPCCFKIRCQKPMTFPLTSYGISPS
ncbi:hypothetical protein BZZ01_03660 [Nostocales cyanobacterium HT-58-2]|nr:hypothetical protein BZZ01_03660 [Nostocales cyanobacterium HT-58-2]